MKVATITETKNQLSALLDLVRNGEVVQISDRGTPVAQLKSVVEDGPDRDSAGRLARLVRSGVVCRGTAHGKCLDGRPPRAEEGASIVDALLGERAESP